MIEQLNPFHKESLIGLDKFLNVFGSQFDWFNKAIIST